MAARNLIGGIAFACAVLCAQEPAATTAANPQALPPVPYPLYDENAHAPLAPERARFDILCADSVPGLYYRVFPQDKKLPPYYRPITVAAHRRSNTYSYNGEGPIELFWYNGENRPPELALRSALPPRTSECMLAVRARAPAQEGGRPVLESFVVNMDRKTFPAGTYVVVNLADIPLAGKVDGILLKPIPRLTEPKRARNGELDVYAYMEAEKSIVNVTRSKFPFSSLYRYLICFFPISKNGFEKAQYCLLREIVKLDTEVGEALQAQLEARQQEHP